MPSPRRGVRTDPLAHLGGVEHVEPRRGQLERERDALELRAECAGVVELAVVEAVPASGVGRAFGEQSPRVGVRLAHERAQHDDLLARQPERLAAGHHDAHPVGSLQQPIDGDGERAEHVVGVVEEQQDAAGAKTPHDGIHCQFTRAHDGRDRRDHLVGLAEIGEVDHVLLVVEGGRGLAGELDRGTGLPHPGGPDDRDEASVAATLAQACEIVGAPDEAGEGDADAHPSHGRTGVVGDHLGVHPHDGGTQRLQPG